MSSVGASVKFYINEAVLKVEDASNDALAALAFQIEAQTKANIQANGQIDTGFMLNSTYTVTKTGADSYNAAKASATARNPKARMAGRASISAPDIKAAVAVGANYAIFQEEKNSFLFKAARAVANQAKAILEPVYRSKI